MKHHHRSMVGWTIVLLTFAEVCGGSAARMPMGERVIRVAVCQTFCIDSDHEGNLRRIEYALEAAARRKADVACFPEASILGWINPEAHKLADPIPGPTSDRIAKLARKHKLMISIGLCEKDGERLYDSSILVGPDGRVLAKHRKINTLDHLLSPPYTHGAADQPRVFDTPIGRVGMLICADVFKPELVRAVAEESPDCVLIPFGWAADNKSWPEHGKSLATWVASVAQRVRCPVVGTDLVGRISAGPWKGKTYGGQSVVADGKGQVVDVLRDRDAEVRMIELRIADRADPALRSRGS